MSRRRRLNARKSSPPRNPLLRMSRESDIFKGMIRTLRLMGPAVLGMLILAPAASRAAMGEYSTVVEAKIALENTLEARVVSVISRILGPDQAKRFIVIVNIEPNVEKAEIERETWTPEKGGARRGGGSNEGGERGFALPGVPVKRKIGDESGGQGGSMSGGGSRSVEKILKLPASFIKRLSLTLLVDERVPDEALETAQKVAAEMLGVDPTRGDTVTVKRQSFREAGHSFWDTLTSPKTLAIVGLAAGTIMLVLLLLFFFGPVTAFLRGTLRILQEAKPRETKTALKFENAGALGGFGGTLGLSSGYPGESAGVVHESRTTGGTRSAGEEATRPFAFMRREHIKPLLYLLHQESPDTAALVVSYLRPEDAAHVMAGLPEHLQAEVAQRLGAIQQTAPELVTALEQDIKRRIDYIVGGADYLAGILDRVDRAARERILTSLQGTDAELAQQVRGMIFTFDDLMALDDRALQMALREINVSSLAIALRNAVPEMTQRVLTKMSEGAAAMLREEIELGRPVSPARVEEEQRRIIDTVKRLEEEGRITLKRGGAEAPAPQRAAPAAHAVPRVARPATRQGL